MRRSVVLALVIAVGVFCVGIWSLGGYWQTLAYEDTTSQQLMLMGFRGDNLLTELEGMFPHLAGKHPEDATEIRVLERKWRLTGGPDSHVIYLDARGRELARWSGPREKIPEVLLGGGKRYR